ncbi:MAG: O-antigen ligase family protein [Gammaproteobacteria bacterium]|nr:O-antigen ligase family protein [Gammaproteobacteria bacterium]
MKGLYAWIERYFPCPFERGGTLLVIVGVFSTLLYVYTRIAFKDELRDLPQNLMVLTFFISAWGQRHKLKSDLIFKLLILAILIPWLLFGINALIDYETAIKYRSTNDLLKLFLFLPLAWWIGGSRAGAIRMLTIAFLGLITAIALDPNLMLSLSMLWAGQRVDFDIYNAQHGALFFGLVIIFCTCSLSQRVHNVLTVNWGNALIILAGLVGLIGLLGTQTRASFLGLFVSGFAALLKGVWHGNFFGQNHLSKAKVVLFLVLVTGLLAWPAVKILHNRLAAEQTAIHALLTGNLEELSFGSVGIRVHSWAEALQWIAERPVTGWGQKARSDVIQLAERFPDDIKKAGFGHLHNGYFEILLGFGAVGFVFLCFLWVVLLRRIKLAASNDLYAFALYSSIFFLVLNMFESFFIYSSGEFAMSLFMAGGYCQYLARSLNHSRKNASI